MNIFSKIADKFYIKQWNIGLARIKMDELFSINKVEPDFKWIPINNSQRFFADPFLFRDEDGKMNVIYEDFSFSDQYGKISMTILDEQFNPVFTKEMLDTRSHLSYPNVFLEGGKTFIIPESSKSGHLTCYEYDIKSRSLINPRNIIQNMPLLDSTILVHNNKYWLFSTKRGEDSNSKLYIYYADSMAGPYIPHAANPVKNSLNGSRPAGNFIFLNGHIYRPSQNCAEYYGKSISINKVIVLNENEFVEETVLEIKPPKQDGINFGIHTINVVGDVIVIDALRRIFMPFEQAKIFLKKIFGKAKAINSSTGLLMLYQGFCQAASPIETTFL